MCTEEIENTNLVRLMNVSASVRYRTKIGRYK